MAFSIKPAQPISERLMIAIAGPQASGKTTTALRLATGIVSKTGGKILMIDTERRRALTYAKNFKFDHLELDAPYSPERYDEALTYAEKQGYGEGDVIIIDSMTHEHEGPGGVLELHEKFLDDKCGNDYRKREKLTLLAWGHAKKGRKRLINYTLAQTKAHIILCFRAKEKTGYAKDHNNKDVVSKLGVQPIGGEEYFFEMSIGIILPEGAAGRPDWTEKASRINEYGDGPMRRILCQPDLQISEHTGMALAELCSVPEKAISEEQAALIKSLLQETQSDVVAFLAWVKADNVDSMKASLYEKALARLEEKKSISKSEG